MSRARIYVCTKENSGLHWTDIRQCFEDTLSINELFQLARQGGKDAEGQLFSKLTEAFSVFVQHRISDEANRKEVVQQTVTAIAGKYRDISFETSFSAWAYRVLENNLRYFYRTKRYRDNLFVREPQDSSAATGAGVDPLLKRKLRDCLRKINRVHSRHARLINLRYQGYSPDEICEKLGLTRNNIYVMLSRVRKLLKKCLETGEIN